MKCPLCEFQTLYLNIMADHILDIHLFLIDPDDHRPFRGNCWMQCVCCHSLKFGPLDMANHIAVVHSEVEFMDAVHASFLSVDPRSPS